jgi:hypothetical protein
MRTVHGLVNHSAWGPHHTAAQQVKTGHAHSEHNLVCNKCVDTVRDSSTASVRLSSQRSGQCNWEGNRELGPYR